jgi:hypothetical protein
VRKQYQRKERKSNHKFEVVRGQELLVRVLWSAIIAYTRELLLAPPNLLNWVPCNNVT